MSTISEEKYYDTTIIGGGPVGIFTAFYAGMREMSVNIIDSLPILGGQLSTLYPEKYIYDIAGFPKIRAQELIDNLIEQMEQFPVLKSLGESVVTITKLDNGYFEIETTIQKHYSKTIIISAGNGSFTPKLAGVPNEEHFKDANVHYFVQNMDQFQSKNVAILGGGDSAVDWALMLEPIANKVYLIHRRDKFRAHEHSVSQLLQSKVEIVTPYRPDRFVGDSKVEQVVLKHAKADEQKVLNDIDDVLVNFGFISSLGPIANWGLEIKEQSIVVNSKMQTNIEGIYAVGDICTYDGKVKLIATGFGEAPIAISNAKVSINPEATVQPQHSTSIMGAKEGF